MTDNNVSSLLMALLVGVSVPMVGYAEENNVQWSDAAVKTSRIQAEGLKLYYEPEKVSKNGDVLSVALYATANSANTRVAEEYAFNCNTHEVAQAVVNGTTKVWQAPSPLLPGESLYKLASKLCDWGPGFWKKLMD